MKPIIALKPTLIFEGKEDRNDPCKIATEQIAATLAEPSGFPRRPGYNNRVDWSEGEFDDAQTRVQDRGFPHP
jgi:hypothetical protein